MNGCNLRHFWQNNRQKKPDQKVGLQKWNRVGDADSDGPQKGESGPTPGYSVFTKSTSSYHQKTFIKPLATSLIMIKDYTGEMSKLCAEKNDKAGE